MFLHFYLYETLALKYKIDESFYEYLGYCGKKFKNVVKFTMVNSKLRCKFKK